MRKSGIVTGRKGSKVLIRLDDELLPPASCGSVKDMDHAPAQSCASCGGSCGMKPGGAKERIIEVLAGRGHAFTEGDRVSVEFGAGGAFLGFLLRLGLPLAAGIGSAFLLAPPRWPLALLVAVPVFAAAAVVIGIGIARYGAEPGIRVHPEGR